MLRKVLFSATPDADGTSIPKPRTAAR
jgi:hypothetical protein